MLSNDIDCYGSLYVTDTIESVGDLVIEGISNLNGNTIIGDLSTNKNETSLKVYGIINTTGGITGATGSFEYIHSSNDAIINNISVGVGNNIYSNVILGYQKNNTLTTGYNNSFVGCESGLKITDGSSNSFFGYQSGYHGKSSYNNTYIGYKTGYNSTNDYFNTFVGCNSGISNISGNNLTLLGGATDIDLSSKNYTSSTAIGYGATITESNQIMLGGYNNSTYPTVIIPGILNVSSSLDVSGNINSSSNITASESITLASDYRIKDNIKNVSLSEYNIDNLRPVYFQFKDSKKESIGLVAHEVQNEFPFLVEGEKDGEKNQTVNYMALVGLLIKEVQELKKELTLVKNELKTIKNK